MDAVTRIDLYNLGRSYLLQRATRIDPAQVDVQGSDANVFVGSVSVVAQQVIKQLQYEVEGLLLATATGEQLDRLAWDRYQEIRKGAAAAMVLLDFDRPTFDGGAGTIDTGALVGTLNNIQYVLLEPASFGASSLIVHGISARAVQAGHDYQVGANYLTKLQAAPFDVSITVNNPTPAAGGEDREDDDTFRVRVQGFWRAARRATKAAIEYGALQVAGVASASAVEAIGGDGQPARVVSLYFADSSGVATPALVTPIMVALEDWRACGIAVLPSLSSPQMTSVTLHLTFSSGVDTVTLTAMVRSAIMGYVNSLGANETLQLGALQSVLQRYRGNGLIANAGSIVAPTGDVVPDVGKTLRTTLELVTTT
jgi:uncharacterized phage protein gp47/JayE